MIDILITTYNRIDFLKRTVESFIAKNRELPFRLFIIDDCSTDGTQEYLFSLQKQRQLDLYLNSERRGLAFSLDMIWNCVEMFDSFFEENSYLCYLQDDMRSVGEEWLLKVISIYEDLRRNHLTDSSPIGFFSGYHSPEHPVENTLSYDGKEVYIKASNSGKNIIGEKRFWGSIGYIPRFNPNGSPRGMPGNGIGSQVDVYLEGMYSGSRIDAFAAAPNCLYRQGKKVLVIPGMLEHMGEEQDRSTWRGDEK